MSLCEAELLTGRTHQIRVQFSAIGHPLIGDTKYGKAKDGKGFNWQALCSYKLTFRFEEDAEHLAYLDGKTFAVKDAWFIDKLGFKFPKELL
jgi:23S rRNA pseudouridine955/2504/2580 synthase